MNLVLWTCALAAGAEPAAKPTQVMVVGVWHMDNPGLDLLNPTVKNILGERRQKEVLDVVARLERFRPTCVALEALPGSTKMQERLDGFKAGRYRLTADERDQLGLRVAKDLGHARVHGIDYRQDMDFGAMMRRAEKDGQGELAGKVLGTMQSTVAPRLKAIFREDRTVRDILLDINDPESDVIGHRLYMGLLRLGTDADYPGADLVAGWYARNLKIATNVVRLADAGHERILVVIGSGHDKLLREFLRETPGIELVDPRPFLRGDAPDRRQQR
jgi:hypothetical protein